MFVLNIFIREISPGLFKRAASYYYFLCPIFVSPSAYFIIVSTMC